MVFMTKEIEQVFNGKHCRIVICGYFIGVSDSI